MRQRRHRRVRVAGDLLIPMKRFLKLAPVLLLGQGLTRLALAAPNCVITTAPAPLIAGQTATLNGGGSAGTGTLHYTWQQVSGPATAVFSSRTAPNPGVRGLIYGVYTWQLQVSDVTGSTQCTLQTTAQWTGTNNTVDASHIKTGYPGYFTPNAGLGIASLQFIANRQSIIFNPCNPPPNTSNCVNLQQYGPIKETAYVDSSEINPFVEYFALAWAATNSYNLENVFLHNTQDIALSAGSWSGMDQFDTGERSRGQYTDGTPQNGVFKVASGSYTDITGVAYAGSIGTITDTLEFGYFGPFDRATFALSVGQSGKTITWQYWNGSAWATLTLASDGTNNLTQNGTIIFNPPGNWARKVENGSQNKYWVRVVISGGGTAPNLTTIKGDNLISTAMNCGSGSSPCTARGWSATDPNRINIGNGNLEYNPTPPATATAHFRYQARTLFSFAPNYQYMNHADVQNGTHHTWGELMQALAAAQITSTSPLLTGNFFDDGGGIPQFAYISFPTGTEFSGSLATWHADQATSLQVAGQLLQTQFGSGFYSLVNTDQVAIGLGTGINKFIESFMVLPLTYSTQYPYSASVQTFDLSLTANNPTNSQVMYQLFDDFASGSTGLLGQFNGIWHSWDRGVRGPMFALAAYYMGETPNSQFSYNSLGFTYVDDDQVYTYSTTAVGTLNATFAANPTGAPVTITGNFANLVGVTWTFAGGCGTQITLLIGNPMSSSSSGEQVCGVITDAGHILVSSGNPSPTYHSYPPGTAVTYMVQEHQGTDNVPPPASVYRWGNWFPAVGVDIGTPDPNGLNGGNRVMSPPWKTAASVTTVSSCASQACADVWRRDYTKAIVIMRPYCGTGCNDAELDSVSVAIALGGTYYPLQPDGTTSEPVTSIQLRAAEAAILLKAPRTLFSVSFDFTLPAQATQYQVVLTKPDGSQSTTTCTASPCKVLSSRSGIHVVQWRYLNASNATLESSPPTPVLFQ
jgi:hypothetical protein